MAIRRYCGSRWRMDGEPSAAEIAGIEARWAEERAAKLARKAASVPPSVNPSSAIRRVRLPASMRWVVAESVE